MSNTPKIRTKGFTDSWLQCQLGELVQFSKGSGYSKSDLVESGTPIILYGRLYTKYETVITDVDTFAEDKESAVYSIGGEVIVPASGETAEDISIASVIAKSGVIIGGDLNIITPPQSINPAFLAISISHGKPHNDMAKMAQGKTVVHLHNTDLEKITLNYPDYQEQLQISTIFSDIDKLISLQRAKLEKLRNLKQSMLNKMFPQDGKKVPEVRFKGFTGDWEQRKSGEIAPLRGGFAFKSNEYSSEGIPIVRISNILSDGVVGADYAFYDEQENDEAFTLNDGAAVLAMSGATTGKVSVLHAEKEQKFYQNQRVGYFVPTEKCDYSFIRSVVKSQLFMKQLSAVLVAGAQPNVSAKEIDDFKYLIPSSEKEQEAIGLFFESLDNLITLHQRKLTKFINLKKSLLNQMFVNGE